MAEERADRAALWLVEEKVCVGVRPGAVRGGVLGYRVYCWRSVRRASDDRKERVALAWVAPTRTRAKSETRSGLNIAARQRRVTYGKQQQAVHWGSTPSSLIHILITFLVPYSPLLHVSLREQGGFETCTQPLVYYTYVHTSSPLFQLLPRLVGLPGILIPSGFVFEIP